MLQLIRPPSLTPLENHQRGQWIRFCHIILMGVCECAVNGGTSGYCGSFVFLPNPEGSIGDMLKVVA